MYFCSKVGCSGHSSPSQRCADLSKNLSFTLFDLPRVYDNKKPTALYYCDQPSCIGHRKPRERCAIQNEQTDIESHQS